ncbi:MAG: IS1/IS1595 family N-terminal zinc-binding domain-containing protein [Waterburya sp.]
MKCLTCGEKAIKSGKTKSGKQRYRCKYCQITFTGNKSGRPTLGDRPLTNAEHQAKFRQKV